MLWSGVVLTTAISCLLVFLLLIFLSCNMFKIILQESLPTPLSTHTSLLLERLLIGCPLNTILHSRLPYWCTSSCIVVIQNILHLSLNLDIVSITHINVFEVRHFATSVCKTTRHFGFSFASDATKIWNDLPDDICLANSLHSLLCNGICYFRVFVCIPYFY